MIFISSVQSNEAKASDQNLSDDAILAISKILEKNGIDVKRLILLTNPKEKKSEEEIINARLSGICCKRWIYGKGYAVNCLPYRGLMLNELFRKSCSDMGGEEQMSAKYGLDIKFD